MYTKIRKTGYRKSQGKGVSVHQKKTNFSQDTRYEHKQVIKQGIS